MKWFVVVCFIAFFQENTRAQFVLLNEYGGIQEEVSITWAELYNPTQETQELVGCKLQLEGVDLFISVPNVAIAPLSYYVFDFQESPLSSDPSVDIYLDEATPGLKLLNAFNGTISSLNWVCVPAGNSYGLTGGFPSQAHFNIPSPAAQNGTNWTIIQKQDIELSHPSGFYNQATIDISPTSETNLTYRYTLDGEEVNSSSLEWPSSGLVLTSANANETSLSHIVASDYQVPTAGPQEVAHTLSVKAFTGGCPVSDISRHTYFIGEEPLNGIPIPIVSISTTDDHLFGDDGIYGFGITGENFVYRSIGWERPATIAYFNEDHELQLEQNIGIRIRGNGSRYLPQKSIKIYARNEYDDNSWMNNVFFHDSSVDQVKRLILRTPRKQFLSSLIEDHLSMEFVKDLNIDAPNVRLVVLFLNGEFWGVYSLQESMDQFYLESRYNLDDDEVEITENPFEGQYAALVQFASSHDLSVQANFDALASIFDTSSAIDYYCAQFFLANWDWPHINMKVWSAPTEGALSRYFMYDCDACLDEYQQATLTSFYPSQNDEPYALLFSRMMQNDGFRSDFMRRMNELLRTDFTLDRLMIELDKNVALLAPLVDYQVSRWGYPASREAWEDGIESIRTFLMLRPFAVREYVEEQLGYSLYSYPNPCRAGERITIDSHSFLSNDFAFEIVNPMGKTVQVGHAMNAQITIGELEEGVYILRTESQGFLLNTRIIVVD